MLAMSEKTTAERPSWQWNEMQQVGTDYTDPSEVAVYEERMGQFRDLAAEDAGILARLELRPGSHVLEIGTGTGHFALTALAAGHRVTAADVSALMLEYAAAKAERLGLTGLTCLHTGFLGLSLPAGSVDGAVSVAALHHLPDAWKLVALNKLHTVLRPGARLVLRDVVLCGDYPTAFTSVVDELPEAMRVEAERHVAQEFSTMDWMMEAMLERAGFSVRRGGRFAGSLVEYVCQR